jgi:hypothetical protein
MVDHGDYARMTSIWGGGGTSGNGDYARGVGECHRAQTRQEARRLRRRRPEHVFGELCHRRIMVHQAK